MNNNPFAPFVGPFVEKLGSIYDSRDKLFCVVILEPPFRQGSRVCSLLNAERERVQQGSSFTGILEAYRKNAEALNAFRKAAFPAGTKVAVNAPAYKGPGIAAYQSECPVDVVAVTLGNGNTWWYPIECVQKENQKEEKV